MKTLTLQGEQHKFEYLYKNISIKDKDENKIPYEVEIRVYLIDTHNIKEQHWNELTDEEFMVIAEGEGNVHSLNGFQEAFNNSDINTEIDVVRFISVPIY